MLKADILKICKELALEQSGWEFSSQTFKNKSLVYGYKAVYPLLTFDPISVALTPMAGICHKEIMKLGKNIFGGDVMRTSWINLQVAKGYKESDLRITYNEHTEESAKQRIRKIFEDGIEIIEKTYDFSSEKNLLENIPVEVEGQYGYLYCLVRAYLGDFEYVQKYRARKLEVSRPYVLVEKRVDQIMAHFGIKPIAE